MLSVLQRRRSDRSLPEREWTERRIHAGCEVETPRNLANSERLQHTGESAAAEFQERPTPNKLCPSRGGRLVGIITPSALFAWDIILHQPRGVVCASPGRGQRPAGGEERRKDRRPEEPKNPKEIKRGRRRGGEGEWGIISASLGWDLLPRRGCRAETRTERRAERKEREDVIVGSCENVKRTHPSGRQHRTPHPERNL